MSQEIFNVIIILLLFHIIGGIALVVCGIKLLQLQRKQRKMYEQFLENQNLDHLKEVHEHTPVS